MNHGFINDKGADPKAYVFGSGQLQSDILQPDGQWDDFLPADKFQNLNGVETYACATYGTFNAIETVLRKRYGEIENYSDRYTAFETGTQAQKGNSPHVIAEYIRSRGAVYEANWPFSADVKTPDEYYAPPPFITDKFSPEFDFGHDYVASDPQTMMDALRYSPLGVSVYAWVYDQNGYAYRPDGVYDEHWCVCYGYVEGQYWKLFDSYDNTHKKLRWDQRPEMIKRYHVTRTVASQEQLSLLAEILHNIADFLRSLNPFA